MEGQRAVGQVERRRRQLQGIEVGNAVLDGRVVGITAGAVDHVLRQVQAQHRRGALLAHPARGPAKPTTQIDHPLFAHLGEQGANRRPLGCTVQAKDLTGELAVPGEEGGVVVDVLGHGQAPAQAVAHDCNS